MAISLNFEENAMKFENAILHLIAKYIPHIMATDYEVSSTCQEDMQLYYQDLKKFTPWAVNMYAASSNFLEVIIDGYEIELGNYDQCLNVEVRKNNFTKFRGQHCRATFQFKQQENSTELLSNNFIKGIANATDIEYESPYTLALCVPSTCSGSDVQFLLNDTLQELQLSGDVSVDPKDCYHISESHLSPADIAIICMIALFLVLLITSTTYDVITSMKFQNHSKGVIYHLLTTFSVYTNGKYLLDTNVSSDTMACLNGLRYISIFWILMGHTVYMDLVTPHINQVYLKVVHENLSNMLILNATLATDTFFLLSGLLLSYKFMKDAEKKITYNIFTSYIKRYARLTPPYAFVIFFYATLLYRLGSGPVWNSQVGMNRDFCVDNWWTNLLYINNYVDAERMCLSQSWYLAMDMQLFLVAPIFLYSLANVPRFGKILLSAAILISIMIPFIITFFHHLTATMLYNKDIMMIRSVYTLVYTRTYARAGPYLIGIGLGYIMFKTRGTPIKIPKILVALGWITSIGSCLAVLFGVAVFYNDLHGYNALESSVYAGMHRAVWAIGISWIIFACVKNYGGPVDTILSWKLFIPLSRLTYSIYLSHYIILLCRVGITRSNSYLSEYNIIYDFAGTVLLSTLLATLISLAFEIPFINVINICFGRSQGNMNGKEERNIVTTEENLETKPDHIILRTNFAFEPDEIFTISYNTHDVE